MIFETGRLRIARLGIGAAKGDKADIPLALFGRGERLIEFPGDVGGKGGAADGDAAAEYLVRLDEDEIGRAGADIDEERAAG